MSDPCCITITVPTYQIGTGSTSVDVVTDVLPSMATMEVASLTGNSTQTLNVTIPTYTTTTVAQTFPFSATFGVEFVEDVTKDERLVVTDVFQDAEVIKIPVMGTQPVTFATLGANVNRTATIKVPTYTIGTSPQEIDWTTTINLPLVTNLNTTPGQFVSNVTACTPTTLSYLSDKGTTTTKKIDVSINQFDLVTTKQKIRGEVTGLEIPSCDIPILKSTGSTTIPSLSYENSSLDIPVLKSKGSLSLYNYALGGFSPISISGATATIPPCDFSVWQPNGSEKRTFNVPTYTVGTTTEEVQLGINIPSCEFTSYSLKETPFTVPVHWLSSTPRIISCDFQSFTLVTEQKTVPWEATWDIPKYENKAKKTTIGVREPQFEKVVIPECETIYNSYYENNPVKIEGDIDVDFGTLDKTIVVPEIRCKKITICEYQTRNHQHKFTVYKPTYKKKDVTVPIEGLITGKGYKFYIPKVTVRSKTIVCKGQTIIVPGCSFSTYSLTYTSSLVSLRSLHQPYYSKSSTTPRELTPCSPGGYNQQPPAPTWTNTGRAKIQIEVVLRDGIAKYKEGELKGAAGSGWFLDDPEKQLCLRIRDYKTGEILREIDNTVGWWSWVTARDAENVHNDIYPPYGNIVDGDPRYDQNKIYMVKGNVRAERHHQVENISYMDTPKQGGHLTQVDKVVSGGSGSS
jgi:hypothetical protein